MRQDTWRVSLPTIVAALCVAVALVPLFPLRTIFAIDWINHLWAIEYFGEYLLRNAAVPDVINTEQLVGAPLTTFYGSKFYGVAGAISAVLGAAVTVRLLACAVLLLQFWQVHRAMILLGAERSVAIVTAVLTTWAIYPLTNLYNRSALTEFFAVAFLTCSLASLLCIVLNRKLDRQSAVLCGFMFAVAAMTHPLTAAFGALLLSVIGGIGVAFAEGAHRLRLVAFGVVNALLIGIVMSPWLFVLWIFRDRLPIADPATNSRYFRDQGFFPDNVDNIWSRLSPMPLDLRSITRGIEGISTPYLDAQVSVPLLLLGAVLAVAAMQQPGKPGEPGTRIALGVGLSAILMAVLVLVLSVRPSISGWFGGLFDILQFPYRLTAYVNLFMLAAIIALGALAAARGKQLGTPLICCLTASLALAAAGVAMKLVHANAIATQLAPGQTLAVARALETGFGTEDPTVAWIPQPFRSTDHLNRLPTTLYGSASYTTEFTLPPADRTLTRRYVAFRTMQGQDFGRVPPIVLDLAEPTIVVTNVQPFAWNVLALDGAAIPRAETMVVDIEARGAWGSDHRLAVIVPAGRHELTVRFAASRAWSVLDFVSWVCFLLWLAACLVVVLGELLRRPAATAPSDPRVAQP